MEVIRACIRSLASVVLATGVHVAAQTPAEFAGADLKMGETLIADKQCVVCHQRKVGGDGSAIYRPGVRIKTADALRGKVEQCSLELNLSLFPDETTAIAAVLNRDHYRFR